MTSTRSDRLGLVAWSAAAILVGCVAAACGSSSAALNCTPGQSATCHGPGGCVGFQTCNSAGTFDPCSCPPADAAIPPDDGPSTPDAPNDGPGIDDATVSDASDASDAAEAEAEASLQGDGAPWSPSALSGLVVWLDDTVGMIADPQAAGHVKVWQDQSGNGNNARADTPTPILDPVVIHQHDAVSCDNGSHMYIPDSSTLQFGTGDYGMVVVARLQENISYNTSTLLGKGIYASGVGMTFDSYSLGLRLLDGGKSIVASFTTGKFAVVVARGAAMDLRVDGYGSNGPTSTSDVSVPGSDFILCQGTGTGSSALEVAEVLIVKGTLSDGDVTNIHAYFKTKFNL